MLHFLVTAVEYFADYMTWYSYSSEIAGVFASLNQPGHLFLDAFLEWMQTETCAYDEL